MANKIAFFSISTHFGGAERSLYEFLCEFKKEHDNFLVVFPKHLGPFVDELNQQKITNQTIRLPSWLLKTSRQLSLLNLFSFILVLFYLPIYLYRIHQFVKKENINIIHSTGIKFHCFLCVYSTFNTQVRIYIHVRDIIKNPFLLLFFKIFKNNNITFIANSKATAQEIENLSPVLIYNGISAEQYHPSPTSLKSDLKLKPNDKLIAIVGAIARWKGQREFIQVAERLLQNRNDFHFLIVGNEIYDTKSEHGELAFLQKEVNSSIAKNHFHFMGFQKKLNSIYSGIDLLVHASIRPEPFGRVILEAMFCGCPVTASNTGGALEIIEHEKNGLLHDMKDLKSLEKNILRIFEQIDLKEKLVKQAHLDCQFFKLKDKSHELSRLILKNEKTADLR